jgi:hypothetical protein
MHYPRPSAVSVAADLGLNIAERRKSGSRTGERLHEPLCSMGSDSGISANNQLQPAAYGVTLDTTRLRVTTALAYAFCLRAGNGLRASFISDGPL